MMRFSDIVCTLLVLVVGLVPDTLNAQTYRGSVPIARPSLNSVETAPDVKVYPGESVTIFASGTPNVNQHNYETRRCKYMGLKCWYEDRSDTQILGADRFEIEVALVDSSNTKIAQATIDGGQPVTLSYPLGDRFERGATIQAYVKSFDDGKYIDRRNCGNRPEYCSSGDVTLTIGQSNTDTRFADIQRQFERFRANSVPAQRIRNRDYVDALLINTDDRSRDVQTLMAEHIPEWVKAADKSSQGAIIQLIQFALGLSDDHANLIILNRARLDGYIKQGDYVQLESYAKGEVERMTERCAEQCSISDARALAGALKALATAQAEKRARNETSDITLAVATLGRGTDVLEQALHHKSLGEIEGHLRLLADLYEDAAAMLSLLRTQKEIRKAVTFMEQSVCLHRLSLNAKERASEMYNATQCRSSEG